MTIYCGTHIARSLRDFGFRANFVDVQTAEEFWISGRRKDGQDRLHGERVPVHTDLDVRTQYWTEIREHPERADDAEA